MQKMLSSWNKVIIIIIKPVWSATEAKESNEIAKYKN